MLVLAVRYWLRPADGVYGLVKRNSLAVEWILRVGRDIGRLVDFRRCLLGGLFDIHDTGIGIGSLRSVIILGFLVGVLLGLLLLLRFLFASILGIVLLFLVLLLVFLLLLLVRYFGIVIV